MTADGELRTASAPQNPDLFWGLRGGGGNFGIVTALEYRLHPVGPTVVGGLVVHPFAAARDALRLYREFAAAAPDDLTTHCGLVTGPDGARAAAFAVCSSGPPEHGEAAGRPLRAFGAPLEDTVGPLRCTDLQAEDDPRSPPGRLNYWKPSFVHDPSDAAIETLLAQFEAVPSPLTTVLLEQAGGAISRIGTDATAFTERSAPYSLISAGAWTDPAESDTDIRWVREGWAAMRPFQSAAACVSYLDADEPDRVLAASGAATCARLAALKWTCDPDNLLRLNQNIQNIRPTG